MMPSPPPPLSRPLIKAEYDWREGRPHILMQLSLPLFRQTERNNIGLTLQMYANQVSFSDSVRNLGYMVRSRLEAKIRFRPMSYSGRCVTAHARMLKAYA